MKLATHFLFAFGLSITLFADFFVSAAFTSLNVNPSSQNVTTNYIVELASPASSGGARRKRRSLTPHQDLYNNLRKKDVNFTTGTEWDIPDIFVGVVMVLNSTADVTAVATTDSVVAVRPILEFEIPQLVKDQVLTGLTDPALPPDTQSTHVMAGVDKVHAEGNFGAGITIGIIDSGVDYLNPSLGGGFGPGFLVAGGYDFVGDAYDGTNTPVPDPDPMDTCFGHGTHVAGIVAAQPGNIYNITGVAYKSTLYAYRVFGCTGSVQDPVIISALLRAYNDTVDVITLSLGAPSGWTESTTGVIASRIAAKGRVVTASLGDDGAQGAWYTVSPANGDEVIAVGSVDNTQLPAVNATLSDGHNPIPYFSLQSFPVTTPLPVYATSTDITVPNDACNPLPSSTPNLQGYLVVIRRGGCTFSQKVTNAAAKGGRTFFIYNDGSALGIISTSPYVGALIGADDGAYLVNAFKTNANLRVSFPPTFTALNVPGGGLVSSFSGMGPTYDMRMKPSLMAPGGNVLSTLPRSMGSYGLASGTSMATPFVAGSAALILAAKGKDLDTARSVKQLLQNTAGMIPTSADDGAPIASTAQQGAGLINVYQAIHAQSKISISEMLLNDTMYNNNYQFIVIGNPSKQIVTYTITHAPGLTISTVNSTNDWANMAPIPSVPQTASVSLTSTKLTIWPKFVNIFLVTIRPPTGLDPTTFPIYSGFIAISSSLGENFNIPYMGVDAKMRDMAVLDQSADFFGVTLPVLLDAVGDIATPGYVYSLVGADYPAVLYRRAAGTPSLLADLVSPNTTIPGAVQARSLSKRGQLWNWLSGIFGGSPPPSPSDTFSMVPTIGSIQNLPFLPRHQMVETETTGYDFVRIQQYLNTSAIASGEYKLLLRTLKITGNGASEDDYESWLSPVFNVQVPAPVVTTSTNTTSTNGTANANWTNTTSANTTSTNGASTNTATIPTSTDTTSTNTTSTDTPSTNTTTV